MREAIENFHKQFLYEPEIKNQKNLKKSSSFISIGMGGSNLTPKILKTIKPELDILIQSDYGLPELPLTKLKSKLIILSSYSGNTEEAIDAFKAAKAKGLNMAVIATGGELLCLAIKSKVPYIEMPDTGIQPRLALGLSIKAFLKIMGEESELKKVNALAKILRPNDLEKYGKKLALQIKNHVPVIYTSARNFSLAYNWKIKLNETGKIPAFYNIFPELNHNEMTGFDVEYATRGLSNKFYFIVLKDKADDRRIYKRMEVLEKLYKDRNLKIEIIDLTGKNAWHKIFSSLVLADWVAYNTALQYGVEAEQVPMVEEFKKLILD